MNVFQLKRGQSGIITGVGVGGSAGERLNLLGVKRGQRVTALAFSIFKGSVLLGVGYSRVAIRKSIASRVQVDAL